MSFVDDYAYGGGDTTELRLYSFGIPPYSARGLTQTLEPIAAANGGGPWRTINGGLLDVSGAQFRKFKSTITCNDQQPPAIDGVWPGRSVIVDCIQTLAYKTEGHTPSREVVPGSSYVEGLFTIYRPRLSMRVFTFNVSKDEYGAAISWSMSLEEE